MRNNRRQDKIDASKASETKNDDLDDEVDALFQLPLAEFTGARNALAAKLKKSGRADEAASVKALSKPSISAWAVNQLYWNHREAFDLLLALAERFHRAQKSGKVADMRASLDARREVLSELSDIAASDLRDAGHNPSLDTIHRITTTLEGLSAIASRSDGPRPGRLTHDVDPPGFESFGSFVPRLTAVPPATKQEAGGRRQAAGTTLADIPRPTHSKGFAKSDREAASARHKQDKHQIEATRKAKIAAARVSLQDAKRSLTEARATAQGLEAAQKKADAEAMKTEKYRRDAEEELRKTKAAAEDAAQLARSVAEDLKGAAKAVDDAERIVEKASKELESLFRESSGK